MTRILVDGDILGYSAGAGEDPALVAASVDGFMRRLQQVYAGKITIFLTHPASPKGGRYHFLPTYQKTRKSPSKTPLRDKVLQRLRDVWEVHESLLYEADDEIAQLARSGTHVIVSKDKDLRMLPGIHVDWDNPLDTARQVTPLSPLTFDDKGHFFGPAALFYQILVGDKVDNVKGLKVRPTQARKLLEGMTYHEARAACWDAIMADLPALAPDIAALWLGKAEDWRDRVRRALMKDLDKDRFPEVEWRPS